MDSKEESVKKLFIPNSISRKEYKTPPSRNCVKEYPQDFLDKRQWIIQKYCKRSAREEPLFNKDENLYEVNLE